jgi:hypothetical protein
MIEAHTLWRHKKTGGIYQIVTLAKIEATMQNAVVYRSIEHHGTWVRPVSEFLDGRFERVLTIAVTASQPQP